MPPGRSPGSMTPGVASPSFLLSPHLSPFMGGFSPFNDAAGFSPTSPGAWGVCVCPPRRRAADARARRRLFAHVAGLFANQPGLLAHLAGCVFARAAWPARR